MQEAAAAAAVRLWQHQCASKVPSAAAVDLCTNTDFYNFWQKVLAPQLSDIGCLI